MQELFIQGDGKLIYKVKQLCKSRLNHKIISILKDGKGVYGFVTRDFILCAREYKFEGHIVSCHRDLIMSAIEKKISIVMFVKDDNIFYIFNPIECFTSGTENIRGHIIMIQFDIHLGRNYEQ